MLTIRLECFVSFSLRFHLFCVISSGFLEGRGFHIKLFFFLFFVTRSFTFKSFEKSRNIQQVTVKHRKWWVSRTWCSIFCYASWFRLNFEPLPYFDTQTWKIHHSIYLTFFNDISREINQNLLCLIFEGKIVNHVNSNWKSTIEESPHYSYL